MTNTYNSGATVEDAGHGGLQVIVTTGPARFVADEPVDLGGLELGPTPHDLVCAGLAACTAQTLRLYAKRKAWPLGEVTVEVSHALSLDQDPPDIFTRTLSIHGPLDETQRQRLIEIAEKCPVHLLLTNGASVETLVAPVA